MSSKQPRLTDAPKALWAWAAYRWNKIPEYTQVFSVLLTIALSIWLVISIVADTPSPLDGVRWVGSQAKSAVCWPIRKAVECCVPGLRDPTQPTTKLYVLSTCGKYSESAKHRIIVATKSTQEPVYTVSPILSMDQNATCGVRWASTFPAMRVMVNPAQTTYMLHSSTDYGRALGDGLTVQVTKATYDKVEVGDIVELCGNLVEPEAEGYERISETVATFVGREDLQDRFNKQSWDGMVTPLISALNKINKAECEQDKRESAARVKEQQKWLKTHPGQDWDDR